MGRPFAWCNFQRLFLKNSSVWLASPILKVWGAYGDLGYEGLGGNRAKPALNGFTNVFFPKLLLETIV